MNKVYLLLFFLLFLKNNSNSQCNPPDQEICMVTADTIIHTYAVIIWEKVVTTEIDSFFIYRRNGFGLYDKIGATHYSDPGEFWDLGVDLNQNFSGLYKYKISTLDTCGNESLKSKFHKPIHLIYTGLGNFQYDDYEIETISPNYFFELNIDLTGSGSSWQVINSVPPGNYIMQDAGYAANSGAVYHVRAILPSSCDPTRVGVNTSRSNIKNQSIINETEEFHKKILNIYPNPANNSLNFEKVAGLEINYVEIFNSLGQLCLCSEIQTSSLNITDLDPGIYHVQIHTNAGIIHKQIVKF